MKKSDRVGEGGSVKARGVLHPAEQDRHVVLTHHAPSAPLVPYVEHYWHVRWSVDGVYETKVLSHPNVHLVAEAEGVIVYGVTRDLFTRRLEGDGHVLGVKFRPGAFRAFCGGPVSALLDRRVAASEYFGPEADALGRTIRAAADPAEAAALAEDFLLPRIPARPDPEALRAADLVARFTAEPSLFRVFDAAAAAGLSVRALQRLFSEYVGASPKWVLRRARLHEVATRADDAAPVDWSALAAELGYADQPHLIRDFTATVGHSPARYAHP